ncbi:MAG: glycosyltransferase family 2 protein [Gallionellaceae bacterium]|nr:MAG: glycosyltransferase family 2 protein [Gallionellaceae bacterium]
MKPNLNIIIVNWNAGTQLAEAFGSIVQYHHGLVASVIIVDNASTDDSLAQVEALQNLPFQLQIIRNPVNRGFGAACNQGAAQVTSEYLIFLNPDMKLFEDSLSKPIYFMQQPSNSDVGICGIRLVDEEGNASTSAARFPTLKVMAGQTLGLSKLIPGVFPAHLLTSDDLKESGIVDQVIGAFFLIRKSIFDRCGGFDERFFVYFEEVDLSLRAKQLGYASYFMSEVAAFHKGGGCSDRVKAARLFYSLRSRILYAQKHYSTIEFVALVLLTGIELPMRLMQGVIRASWSDIQNTFAAYTHLVTYLIRRV